MRTSDFDFELPPELIAQSPAEPRDASRLLVLSRDSDRRTHHVFSELPSLLRPGDLLVVNDTRVMAARLFGERVETGGRVEVLLLRPMGDPRTWEVLMNPLRQAMPGRLFRFAASDGPLDATVVSRTEETATIAFDREFDPATVGNVPLPPYITGFEGDPGRYQTVYAQTPRSAAAPTAGLHFTDRLLTELATMGVHRTAVTLEVGIGTFRPVKVEDPRDHNLHAERVTIPADAAAAIQAAKREGRRVIAVGTTVIRTLEHVARERGRIEPFEGDTSLRILPGDDFLVIDGIITNFHLPKSTLLMLICAFAGQARVLDAYREAVASGYRFYSFGDAMLILPG